MALTERRRERARPLPTTVLGVLAVLLALLVLSLALVERADAYLYWTQTDDALTGTIGRAKPNGKGVDQQFITLPNDCCPGSIAVDASYLYWANSSDGIARANRDGTGVDQGFIGGFIPFTGDFLYGITDVAVNSDYVYWTDFSGTIGRANLDGSGIDPSFIGLDGVPYGVAVDTNHIYWTNGNPVNTIGRANLDGSGVDENFIVAAGVPHHVRVDASHIYWVSDTIGRANLDGSGIDPSFIPLATGPYGLAVDARHVYWATPDLGTIGRTNLDGSGVDNGFITLASVPSTLAVDADATLPETEITKGAPNKLDKRKFKFKFKSSEPNSTFECKLDKKKWKACVSPKKVKVDEGKHKFKVRAVDAAGNVDSSPAKDKFKVVD